MNQTTKQPIRIMVVGTLPPPICGTTVLVEQLIAQLEERPDVEVSSIETGQIRGGGVRGGIKFVRLLMQLVRAFFTADVVTMHLNPLAVPILGPVAVVASRISGTPVMVRLFGGQDFRDFPGISGKMFHWVAHRVSMYLVETHRLIRSAEQAGIRAVEWYPNSRPFEETQDRSRFTCRRLVFVGLVKPSKGVQLIIDIADKLPAGVSIDVFGPFMDGMSESDFRQGSPVQYKGVIPSGQAIQRLAEYDALLLPTHWEGEGHPGVILEAYHAGIPVITTQWRDIPEIVDETCGILIPPRSSEQLLKAIESLVNDDAYYQRLAAGTLAKSELFRASTWTENLVAFARRLCGAEA